LDAEAQKLFSRRSGVVGGFIVEGGESVGNVESGAPCRALDGAPSLVDQNLLRHEVQTRVEGSHEILQTTHESARECLIQSVELDAMRSRHRDHFLALAEEAEKKLNGPEQETWLNRLESEHDNLRAALEWSVERGEMEAALRLGGAMGWF